jgi:hypothetical protein
LIDFGLSLSYDPKDGPPLAWPVRGGDKTVPEIQGEKYSEKCDPFPVDIYGIGNMIKQTFLDVSANTSESILFTFPFRKSMDLILCMT